MENASKALIIAGAILLSILIIGLGMFIFQQAKGVLGDTGLNDVEVKTYNEEFLQYVGVKKGADVKALGGAIKNHNLAYPDDATKWIGFEVTGSGKNEGVGRKTGDDTFEDPTTKISDAINSIKSGWTYKVTETYDKNSGKIISMTAEKQNSK